MINYFEFQRMERWTQRVRRQTQRDMYRLRQQRLRDAEVVKSDPPLIAVLGRLHIAHAWWRSVVLPQIDRAAAQVFPARTRQAERLLPDAAVRQP